MCLRITLVLYQECIRPALDCEERRGTRRPLDEHGILSRGSTDGDELRPLTARAGPGKDCWCILAQLLHAVQIREPVVRPIFQPEYELYLHTQRDVGTASGKDSSIRTAASMAYRFFLGTRRYWA